MSWSRWLVSAAIVLALLMFVLKVMMRGDGQAETAQNDVTIDDVINMVTSRSALELRSRGVTVERCTKRNQSVGKDSDMLVGCRVSGTDEQLAGWIASRRFAFGPRVVNRLPPEMDLIEVGGPFPAYEIYGDVAADKAYSVGTVVVVDAGHRHAIVYDRTLLVVN